MARLTVGLDIGTSAVRAAEIDISKSTPVLLTYGQVGLPPGLAGRRGDPRHDLGHRGASRSSGRTGSSAAPR